MTADVIIPARLAKRAQEAGFNGENESGAWALFSSSSITRDPWSGEARRRYILRELRPLTAHDIDSASPVHLTVRTASFMRVLKDAATKGLTPGFLHGHPSGYDRFSPTDDENERALLAAVHNRNGCQSNLISLLALPNGVICGRRWRTATDADSCPVAVTGARACCFNSGKNATAPDPSLDRQARVFGDAFNQTLATLRVLVVGAGGTGSPLVIMLARAGVKHIAIIDPDLIEATNLHRLHGARMEDIGEPKSQTLARHIEEMGLSVNAVHVHGNIIDAQHRDLLKSVDVIFCATDDHAGRMMLNRYAYFYETPVIDLGLAIAKDASGGLRDMTGRVSLLYPGAPCLNCRGVIDMRRAREEELMRRDPENYAAQVKEGYIVGGGDPEPAFISMTTSIACMALDEFTQMFSGYRGDKRNITQRLRRFQIPEDRCSGGAPDPDCPICGAEDDWGAGDVTPFLDRVT